MAVSVQVRIGFLENDVEQAAFNVDTAIGCRAEATGDFSPSLRPKDIDLLNDIVKLLRGRKDMYPPLHNPQKDVAAGESAENEGGE